VRNGVLVLRRHTVYVLWECEYLRVCVCVRAGKVRICACICVGVGMSVDANVNSAWR